MDPLSYDVVFEDRFDYFCGMELKRVDAPVGAMVVEGFCAEDSSAVLKGVKLGDYVLRVAGENLASAGRQTVMSRLVGGRRPVKVTFYRAAVPGEPPDTSLGSLWKAACEGETVGNQGMNEKGPEDEQSAHAETMKYLDGFIQEWGGKGTSMGSECGQPVLNGEGPKSGSSRSGGGVEDFDHDISERLRSELEIEGGSRANAVRQELERALDRKVRSYDEIRGCMRQGKGHLDFKDAERDRAALRARGGRAANRRRR